MHQKGNTMTNRVTVQYCARGQYGEFTAKSKAMTSQQMVDHMYAELVPGISIRFIGEKGIMVPTGFNGDPALYIPAKRLSVSA